MGVHPTVGNGTTCTGTCSAREFPPGRCFGTCQPWVSQGKRRSLSTVSSGRELSLRTAVKRVTTSIIGSAHSFTRSAAKHFPPDRMLSPSPLLSPPVPFPRSQQSAKPTSPSNFHIQPWLENTRCYLPPPPKYRFYCLEQDPHPFPRFL